MTSPQGFQVACRDCRAPIVLVQIVPEVLSAGQRRRRIPLELDYDPANPPTVDGRPLAPSHALTAGRTQCRPLHAGEDLAPNEYPALTHFAVCPVRRAKFRRREALA